MNKTLKLLALVPFYSMLVACGGGGGSSEGGGSNPPPPPPPPALTVSAATVDGRTLTNNISNVSLNPVFTITLSSTLRTTSVNQSPSLAQNDTVYFRYSDPATSSLVYASANVSVSGSALQIRPSLSLVASTSARSMTYTLIVKRDLSSQAGGTLTSDLSYTFVTQQVTTPNQTIDDIVFIKWQPMAGDETGFKVFAAMEGVVTARNSNGHLQPDGEAPPNVPGSGGLAALIIDIDRRNLSYGSFPNLPNWMDRAIVPTLLSSQMGWYTSRYEINRNFPNSLPVAGYYNLWIKAYRGADASPFSNDIRKYFY